MHINPHKTGLAFGGLLGAAHIIWSLLVAFGWGQALLNFSMWAHMTNFTVVVGPFDVFAAATVIIIAAAIGYALGCVFSLLWNRMHRT